MLDRPFDSFVILAGMRTGSNFLEANLNALDGVQCHGEAFNPSFMGYPKQDTLLGFDLAARTADPFALLDRIRAVPGTLNGFRYFHDHDPRLLDPILDDPRCAKVVLTRATLDSFISLKVAQTTGQWKLTRADRRKTAQVRFDPGAYRAFAGPRAAFYARVREKLQTSGQQAFYLDYEELTLPVLNGLAAFLGIASRLERLDGRMKRQNPEALVAQVENPEEMFAALAELEAERLSTPPDLEPRRPAAVPSYTAAARAPLLYLPIRGGPLTGVTSWMAALDGVSPDALQSGFSQRDLRRWKSRRKGHRSFTVLRHPVARAYHAFCAHLLSADGPETFPRVRRRLQSAYRLRFPESSDDPKEVRRAFLVFLGFLSDNLAGQTSLRVDPAWGSQAQALRGFADFVLPDAIFREDTLERDLPRLARDMGYLMPPPYEAPAAEEPLPLASIYDAEVEKRAARAYRRDYMLFGFSAWQ
jgi:LPS sulfotransferase NodH